ncbi:MAG TPA: hypothetical protein VE913_00755 [Longimicrobium sp.]|nr:hypothetical protein [Longimicrobium sp.]
MTDPNTEEVRFGVCLRNEGYPASLEPRKIYQLIDDAGAARDGFLRVVDESGEDYLYPESLFFLLRVSRVDASALMRSLSKSAA